MANIDAQNKHLVFLEIAKKDLEESRSSYRNRRYSHAIFHLQQSTEKAIKSLILWLIEVPEKDLKTHNARKLLLETIIIPMTKGLEEIREWLIQTLEQEEFIQKLERHLRLKYLKLFKLSGPPPTRRSLRRNITRCINEITDFLKSSNLQQWVDEIIKFNKAIEKLGRDLFVLITVSSKECNKIINFINQINQYKRKLIRLFNKFESELLLKVEESLEDEGKELDEELLLEVDRKFTFFVSFTSVLSISCNLFLLSTLFSEHHSVVTRYPENGLNPLEIFDEKSPLVRRLKEYIRVTKEILRELNSIYYEQSPELMDTLRQLIEKGGT